MVLESHAFPLAVLVNVTAQRVVVSPTSAKIVLTVKTVSPQKKEIRGEPESGQERNTAGRTERKARNLKQLEHL